MIKRLEREIRIGTRGSLLALWQAHWVKRSLENRWPDVKFSISIIKTKGDKILDAPLSKIGGKGLFVKEIEEALIEERIDLAVHSMKDVPTELPHHLCLPVITKRDEPRDCLITKKKMDLYELPQKALLGTSSLRRQTQLLHYRKDFQIRPLRGNLDTRIKKLSTEDLDGIVVAAAGVKRMGWENVISQYFSPDVLIPAIGQGAIGIEIRKGDEEIERLICVLKDENSWVSVTAERAFLKKLGGGCQIPIAGYGEIEHGRLKLIGMVGSIDGAKVIKDWIEGNPSEGEAMGIELAEKILARGGKEVLEECREGWGRSIL